MNHNGNSAVGPKTAAAAISIAGGLSLYQYAPEYLLFGSAIATAITLFVLQVLVLLTYKIVIYPNYLSPLRHLPSPPGASFFNGHFAKILKEPTGAPMIEWINTVPNDGVIWYKAAFNSERVLVTSPKALAEVLVTNSYDFIKPKQLSQTIGRILGIGILFAEGDEHKRQRKGLNPAFAFRHIKELYPIIWTKCEEMVRTIHIATTTPPAPSADTPDPSISNIIEVSVFSNRAALDIIGVAGMSRDFNALANPKNELYQIYKSIFSPSKSARILQVISIIIPLWFLRLLPLKRNNDIRNASATIRATCMEMVKSKRMALERGEVKADAASKDIIQTAIASGAFTDENLVDQLMTFLAAGHETTATSLQWAILSLCQYPHMQTRLRAALSASKISLTPSTSFTSSIPITAEVIDNIPYLHAFCLEVLRLYSPVTLTLRITARTTTIQGHVIPKDTTVILGISALNQDKALWGADASEFNPDRWLSMTSTTDPSTGEEREVERVNASGGASSNYAFMTFLHGPRSCIGSNFARAEFAMLIAAWVAAFETELADDEEKAKFEIGKKVEIQGGITARPKGGVRVKVTPVGV